MTTTTGYLNVWSLRVQMISHKPYLFMTKTETRMTVELEKCVACVAHFVCSQCYCFHGENLMDDNLFSVGWLHTRNSLAWDHVICFNSWPVFSWHFRWTTISYENYSFLWPDDYYAKILQRSMTSAGIKNDNSPK